MARSSRRKKKKRKEARSRVSGQTEGIELTEGCVRPCWTRPGLSEAWLGFAWRPEKAHMPPCRIASLPAYHGATISPISASHSQSAQTLSVLSLEQHPTTLISNSQQSTLV